MKRVFVIRRVAVTHLVILAGGLTNCQSTQKPPLDTDFPRPVHRAATGGGGIDITTTDAREVDLVETVISDRNAYRQHLTELRDFYVSRGNNTKKDWAETELAALGKVQPFRYLLDSEVPGGDLKAAESIPEADALYQKGLDLMREAGRGTPLLTRRGPLLEASTTFRDLVTRYPTSDKIDDAAFMLGEIHADYLSGQEAIAVKWYERAWTWDPTTPHPAMYQAAHVYDYRLHDRDRALELYQGVVRSENASRSQMLIARRRIDELTSVPRWSQSK